MWYDIYGHATALHLHRYTNTCTHICSDTSIYRYRHMHTDTHKHTCRQTQTHMHIFIYTNTHTYMSGQFCLLTLYLVAIFQMKSGPHGPIFEFRIGYTKKIRWYGLERVNWVHNDKMRSNGLERSQLGTQYKYRGYLLRQVFFHFTEKSMDFNIWCPLESWVANVFLQFLTLNLPKFLT